MDTKSVKKKSAAHMYKRKGFVGAYMKNSYIILLISLFILNQRINTSDKFLFKCRHLDGNSFSGPIPDLSGCQKLETM